MFHFSITATYVSQFEQIIKKHFFKDITHLKVNLILSKKWTNIYFCKRNKGGLGRNLIERRRDRDKEREEIEREIERKKTEALRKCNNVLTRLLLRTRTNIDNFLYNFDDVCFSF